MHATATANGVVVAETDNYEVVEGNVYFPPDSLKKSSFSSTDTHTTCPYKGKASYYTVSTGKTELKDAAWYYPETKPEYKKIEGYVAFYKTVVDVQND